jgi:hypothetical protein
MMFGLFKAKSKAVALPSAEVEPERYKGRPLLVLLENYVLDCIGALPSEADARLLDLVQDVFGGDADWKKTLRQQLGLPDGLDNDLREMWRKNQAKAAQRHVQLHPVQFAKMVADENWSHLIKAR